MSSAEAPPPLRGRTSTRVAFGMIAVAVLLGVYLRAQYAWTDNPPDSFAYMAGSLELVQNHRYELRPHNWCRAPDLHDRRSTCRLPGYSAVLAMLRPTAKSYDDFYVAAKAANIIFDLISALACAALLWAHSRRAAVLAAAIVMLHPLPIRMAEAVLTESLVMALTTVIALLLVRYRDKTRAQLVAGALFGIASIVRPDSLVLLPLLAWIAWQTRDRIKTALQLLVPTVILLGGWGVRNYVVSGTFAPIPASACDMCGQPLRVQGITEWIRTWIRTEEDVPIMWSLNIGQPPNPLASVPADAYSSDEERAAVKALFVPTRVPQAELDAKLGEIAHARPIGAKLRQWLWLPIVRSAGLWWHRPTFLTAPNPFRKQAPAILRFVTDHMEVLSALLLIGFAIGVWRTRDRLVFFCAAAIVLRTGALAVLGMVEQRYVLETWPLLVCVAALAIQRRVRPPQTSSTST